MSFCARRIDHVLKRSWSNVELKDFEWVRYVCTCVYMNLFVWMCVRLCRIVARMYVVRSICPLHEWRFYLVLSRWGYGTRQNGGDGPSGKIDRENPSLDRQTGNPSLWNFGSKKRLSKTSQEKKVPLYLYRTTLCFLCPNLNPLSTTYRFKVWVNTGMILEDFVQWRRRFTGVTYSE